MAAKEKETRQEGDGDLYLQEDALLIPENVIDQASQRLFLVSIFVLIQCWKIYDILLIRADSFSTHMALDSGSTVHQSFTSLNNYTFVMKYAVIDGLFIWLLPVLNVPYLRFLPLISFLLTIITTSFTFVLASDSAIPLLSGGFVPIWNFLFRSKELTIVGDSVNPQVVSDMNAHFKGRYTIRYLPESSVRLNPFHYESTCLESSANEFSTFPTSINLPIEFNTTTDIGFMQIQRISPDNTITYLDYSAKDVKKLLRKDYSHLSYQPGYVSKDSRVFYLEIPVKQPGTYKISKVTDKDGAVIRSYKSEFSVAHCPTSRFVYPGIELEYSAYKCVGNDWQNIDWSLPLLELYGVLPLTVEISATTKERRVVRFNATITETTADSGANALTNAVKLTRNALEQQFLKNPQLYVKDAPGVVKFNLLSVTDYLGNTRRYNPSSTDRDVLYSLELKRAPTLALSDKSPQNPLLMNGSKRLHIATNNEVSFPLKVTMGYQNSSSPGSLENLTFQMKDRADLIKGIEIWGPGEYSLIEAEDSSCNCDVDKNVVKITTPKPPAVKIQGSPITDKCIGDIGLQFAFDFRGAAPFKLLYQVFKKLSGTLRPVLSDRGLAHHTILSSRDSLTFSYKPQKEGSYVIVFNELRDAYYRENPILIDEKLNTFTIYSKQRSTYSLFSRESRKVINLCKGEQADIPLSFDGNSPYSFTYEIVGKDSNKVVHREHIDQFSGEQFNIRTPQFAEGGSFNLRLVDVKDSHDCPVESVGDTIVQINSRKYVPEVQIARQDTLKIVEGESVRIPFSYRHTSPSPAKKLGLIVQDLWSDHTRNVSISAADSISVTNEGVYKLSSFRDENCPGVVTNSERSVKVMFHPKPNLTLVANEEDLLKQYGNDEQSLHLKLICQNSDLRVKPVLEGVAPFSAQHRIKYPDGKILEGVVPMSGEIIDLPTEKAGLYEHTFSDVYDALYSERVMSRLNHHRNPSTIRYSVLPKPELKTVKGRLHIQICESKIKNTDSVDFKIPVQLKGKAPFTVSGSIRHSDSQKVERFSLGGIQDLEIQFGRVNIKGSSLEKILSIGDHLIIFEDIVDADGCKTTNLHSQNSVTVSITKVPEITKESNKPYYCVGDHVSYKLLGISPFVVYYNFNGQMRKAEVGHNFERLAAKPGELSIVALEDSSVSRCIVNYTTIPEAFEQLKLKVHQIPSVEISHGDTIIESLHEGDQAEIVFKFSGVPPFEVTYVRTLDGEEGSHKKRHGLKQSNRRKRVVDTKTIKDIWDFEITEVVSQEGTYDAIRVKDAYCEAKRDVTELL